MSACEHPVGTLLNELVYAREWNLRLAAYLCKPQAFLERDQHDQHPNPFAVHEFRFCPECGQLLDRVALGLLSYIEMVEVYKAINMIYTEEHQ